MSKSAAPPEKENHERWVISYADLVTLLLGFFIILYATSKVDADKFKLFAFGLNSAFNVDVREGSPGGSPIHDGGNGILPGGISNSTIDRDFAIVKREIEDRASASGLAGQIVVTRVENSIVIRVPSQLLFTSGSADVRAEALPLLNIAANVVNGVPHQVRVEGHTDNVPVGTEKYPTNWELSSARATAVLRYLIEQRQLEAKRVFAAGFGEFRPVASNLTPEGRALNRRADIVLLYPASENAAPPAQSTVPSGVTTPSQETPREAATPASSGSGH